MQKTYLSISKWMKLDEEGRGKALSFHSWKKISRLVKICLV